MKRMSFHVNSFKEKRGVFSKANFYKKSGEVKLIGLKCCFGNAQTKTIREIGVS